MRYEDEHITRCNFASFCDYTPTPKFSICEFVEHNKKRGVYFIFDREDKIIYIGETKNIKNRFCAHLNISNNYSNLAFSFDYIDLTKYKCKMCRDGRRAIERVYIHKYNPKFNIQSKNINLCEATHQKNPRAAQGKEE